MSVGDYRELFTAEKLPVLQNRTFDDAASALAAPTGDVVLVQDGRTSLIYNVAFDPSLMVYDETYQNEQACSPAFRQHLANVTQVIERHLHGHSLLEVGCGKGFFLEQLQDAGFQITGVDPAYQGSNPAIVKAAFSRHLGLVADGIILRHVLEHIRNPVGFLSEIAAANRGGGIIYIEVPCFDWIRTHCAWFDVFYEHVNYFRLTDFTRMFGRVLQSGHTFGGQYLYALADLATVREPSSGGEPVDLPEDFLASVNGAVDTVRSATGRRNVVWGAASKGVIFSLYLQRAGAVIDDVIDINPAKQNRYLPGSALQVSSPETALQRLSAGDNIFVMNSNYLTEIVAHCGSDYSYIAVDHEGI